MYHIIVYIPESHCETVKQAMFNAGAGRYEHYEHCSWQVLGQGQFKPLTDSQPFIGETDRLEKVTEYRVEMICEKKHLHAVIKALKTSHPYEQPAYTVLLGVDI
jgi:hypothetical protein